MPIHDVTLADVYRLDFGRRTDDAATWAALSGAALGGSVLDVCCGDGRATRGLLGERAVYGVDRSAAFVSAARDAGIKASVGDAEQAAHLRAAGPRPAMVVCAYSSLFLLPHARQADAVEAMAEVALPGALVAVETFVPKLSADRVHDQTVANPNDPTDHRWVRRTTYEVDTGARTTKITRLYGPDPDRWTMRLSEVVYWRDPDEVALLFRRAGLVSVEHSTTTVLVLDALGRRSVVPVAHGMALTVGRR